MSALKQPVAPKKAWYSDLRWVSRMWVEEMFRARIATSRAAGWLRTAEAAVSSNLRSRLNSLSRLKRLSIIGLLDLALIPTATYLAFWLRFDGEIPPEYLVPYFQTLPWVLAIAA